MSKLNCLIGNIISGFVRTVYVLSQICFELDLTNHITEFFAEGQLVEKLKKIRTKLAESNIPARSKYIELIDKLDELRAKRNIVVHSLVLTNSEDENDHMFHNYQKWKNKIVDKTTEFSTSDLINFHDEIRNLHNDLCKLHYNDE